MKAFAARDSYLLVQTLVPMEKWKRDALVQILTSWQELLESALASRTGLETVSALGRQIAQQRTAGDIRQAVWTLKKARDYTLSNVSPAAVCGWLSWTLR